METQVAGPGLQDAQEARLDAQPGLEAFGRGVERGRGMPAGAGVDEVEVGLGVGAIQADEQVVGMGCGPGGWR